MITNKVYRDTTHPLTEKLGYDALIIVTDTVEESFAAVDKAMEKFWKVFAQGTALNEKNGVGTFVTYLFKPSGAMKVWEET